MGAPKKQDYTGNFSVTITTASGETYVLDNASIARVYWIEDIYSFSMVGQLEFYDYAGWLETAPLVGNEMITILYGEQTDYEYKFYGYKFSKILPISETNPTTQTLVSYTFVDPYYSNFHSKHHSLSFKDTKISDIVYQIMEQHIGNIDYHILEETNETLDYFYTGLKTPAENLKWLMNRASGAESGQAGFMLYNTTWPEQFTFCSMEKLLQSKEYIEPEGTGFIYNFEGDNPYYINKVLGHEISHVDQTQLKLLAGGVALGYDIQRKKFLKEEYTYNDALAKYTILGEKSLFASDIEYPELPYTLEAEASKEQLDNIFYSNWIKGYCLQQMISIQVRGWEERHCGGMIEMEWGSSIKDWKINKNMMGKFLVKSCIHQFSPLTQPAYQQKLILIKNGYYDSDDPTLVPAINKNI